MSEFANQSIEKVTSFEVIKNMLNERGERFPLTIKQIENIEARLLYRLPSLYKYLLINLGLDSFDPKEDKYMNAVLLISTNDKRHLEYKPEESKNLESYYTDPNFQFPLYIYPFAYLSSPTNPLCFDLSKMKDGDCPVYEYYADGDMWDANPSGEWEDREGGLRCKYPEKLADTFEEFMLKLVNGELFN